MPPWVVPISEKSHLGPFKSMKTVGRGRGGERERDRERERERERWERGDSERCDTQFNIHLRDGTHTDKSPCL